MQLPSTPIGTDGHAIVAVSSATETHSPPTGCGISLPYILRWATPTMPSEFLIAFFATDEPFVFTLR